MAKLFRDGVVRECCVRGAGKRPTPFVLEGGEMVVRVTQGCLASVVCPLVYGGHLRANLCPQVSPCQMGGGTRPSQRPVTCRRPGAVLCLQPLSRTMGTGLRSQSLRAPRPSYGKLQEPWGKPVEGRLRRALSLRQGREKSRPSDGGPERLDSSDQERRPGELGDVEQLIQTQKGGRRRWLRQYQQV